MEKGKYMVLLAVVLASIVAVPSVSTAFPVRLTESFVMGDTSCQMNVQLNGEELLSASVGPANVKPPACAWDCPEGCWWSCPPNPCCVWIPDGITGSWNCSTDNNPNIPGYVCTSCTTWDGTSWSTPASCPSSPATVGGVPAPTCAFDDGNSEPVTINKLVCTGCDETTGTCPNGNCEPLRFVERNIFEKSGDGSVYCYNSTAGKQVCKTCTTNATTKVTTCVTK